MGLQEPADRPDHGLLDPLRRVTWAWISRTRKPITHAITDLLEKGTA
ncbi:hypothetical protein ACL02R_20955 [Streptomyces sp. MS19]